MIDLIWIYILIFLIILFVLFLLLSKITINFSYYDKPQFYVRYLFKKIDIMEIIKKDKKSKKKKTKDKEKKESDTSEKTDNKKEEKRTNALSSLKDKYGLIGLIGLFEDIIRLMKSNIINIFKSINVDKFDLNVSIVTEDSAGTALLYGRLSGVVYTALSSMQYIFKINDYNINLSPDFTGKKTTIDFDTELHIRPIKILFNAIAMGFKALYMFIKIKFGRNL